MSRNYNILKLAEDQTIKMWTRGVPVEEEAIQQLINVAKMPFVFKHVAAMPDVHVGKGSTIGSVIPTRGAIIPAAVGVDIGCGMMAVRTSLTANDLPDHLFGVRSAIEQAVPHGRTHTRSKRDKGTWETPPENVDLRWGRLLPGFEKLIDKYPSLRNTNNHKHLGTLGTGNHFIEVCLDENDRVWVMLHSGSRGVGNAIGNLFITLAKQDMQRLMINLPDNNLAYFEEGSQYFNDYVEAVGWAQEFARLNREAMMDNVLLAMRRVIHKPFVLDKEAINCHHNYVQKETHFGSQIYVTRKGAVSAQVGELGIIPGSMGAKSFIVRGLGHKQSFCSCSHGAGRVLSRTAAKKQFTIEDQIRATSHVECRKDLDVIDEIPMAYKNIDAVMNAQKELVEIVHQLRQVVCVKG
jgi:tRNA-splicing ligase RtcB